MAWLGADRATMCAVTKGKKVLPAVVLEFDPNGSWKGESLEELDPDSIFDPANQTGMGARAAYYMCMGRSWALALPLPSGSLSKRPSPLESGASSGSLQNTAMNLGQDVGSIAVPGAFHFSTGDPSLIKMQLRPYWRSPYISGLGTFRLADDSRIDTSKPPVDAESLALDLEKPVNVLHKSRGSGRPVFLVAGSTMVVGESTTYKGMINPATLNVTTCTLIPADDPAWNLRLLTIATDPAECYIRLEDPMNATAIRHPFFDCGPADYIRQSMKVYPRIVAAKGFPHDNILVKETLGGKGRTMRKEELDAVNAVRTGIRDVLIRGVGLSTAGVKLGMDLFDGIDGAGRAIKGRAEELRTELPSLKKAGEQDKRYWSKLSAETTVTGKGKEPAGLEKALSSLTATDTNLPGDFKFTFDASAALTTTSGDLAHGLLPDPAAIAIAQSFLPPLVWPKWDPPKPAGSPYGGHIYGRGDDDFESEEEDETDEYSDSSEYY
jgi:hypothetical protein